MTSPSAPVGKPRKAALAAWIGSALEYYDFFIYGTAAALVFGKIFFPNSDPAVATLSSLATFGVGYVARPLGAIVLGHIGDRFGRKRVLVLTVLLMGVATFLVGCLPDYNQIGALAPVLLVVLRLAQGFSAGGEQAGANSMSMEHAPADRRAFFTSWTLSGTQAGSIIATAAFLPVAALPEEALLSWGWRVPFWASAIVVIVALVIRRTLEETPVFTAEVEQAKRPELPIAILFRDNWADVVRVVLAALIASVSTIFGVYALSFAVEVAELDRATMLWVAILANVVALAAIPLWATLADRVGRRPVFIAGALGSAVLTAAYLYSITTGSYVLIFVVGVLLSGVVYSAANGVWPAFYAEMFPTGTRLSGMALGTQIGFAIGGFAPSVAAWLAGGEITGWIAVSIFTAALCVVSAGSAFSARETYRTPMDDLGGRPVDRAAA